MATGREARDDTAPGSAGVPPALPGAQVRELALATVVMATLVLGMYAFGTERAGLRADDAGQYSRMAQSPQFLARLPYTFRVLSPLLAGALPGDVVAGFTILTLLSLVLAGVALYAYQRALGLAHPAALAGAALFAMSGGAVRLLTTPVYVDALSYLAEAAAFLALVSGRFWPFLAAVVLGTLNRETALLLIPLYFATTPRAAWARGRGALVVLLPLGALGGVALLKLSGGGILGGTVPIATIAPEPRAFRQGVLALPDLFDLFSTFGVLWLLAPKNLPGPTDFQRRAVVYAVLVLLQLVIARGDEGRVLSHLFVIVIPLAMLEVQRLLSPSVSRGELFAALLLLACAACMVHARWTFLQPAALRYALVAVGTAAAILIVFRGRRARAPTGQVLP